MTIEEFNNTKFGAGMKIKMLKSGIIKLIIAVDFEECLFGVAVDENDQNNLPDLNWIRCENCELVI